MSNAGPLFRPYDKLVKITLGEKQFEVPDGNMLLRALQFLSPEDISYGKFCWNEECQYCRVNYDLGPDTPNRTAISCKLMVQDGMRVTEVAQEIKYCLLRFKCKIAGAKAQYFIDPLRSSKEPMFHQMFAAAAKQGVSHKIL
jgi:hypothetical protein